MARKIAPSFAEVALCRRCCRVCRAFQFSAHQYQTWRGTSNYTVAPRRVPDLHHFWIEELHKRLSLHKLCFYTADEIGSHNRAIHSLWTISTKTVFFCYYLNYRLLYDFSNIPIYLVPIIKNLNSFEFSKEVFIIYYVYVSSQF